MEEKPPPQKALGSWRDEKTCGSDRLYSRQAVQGAKVLILLVESGGAEEASTDLMSSICGSDILTCFGSVGI
jgi:hypothetical protein